MTSLDKPSDRLYADFLFAWYQVNQGATAVGENVLITSAKPTAGEGKQVSVVISKPSNANNNKDLMLTNTDGDAKIYAGVADSNHLIDATYGAKYWQLTVTIASVAEQDYGQMAGTYYVHIDNTNERVRLSNALTSSTYVGADVSGLYTTFSVADGTLTGGSAILYVAVTPSSTSADEDAFASVAGDWSITIDQTAGTVALS